VTRQLESSTAPLLVETDAGAAFLKAMGNPEGPSALACEYLGTSVASWLGLKVFDYSIIDLPAHLARSVKHAIAGPAFVTRRTSGAVWDGSRDMLQAVENVEDLAGLVVLDTWIRNRDRYLQHRGETRRNLRNVFLADGERAAKYVVYAIDHTHCVRTEVLLAQSDFQLARDPLLFGLFPEMSALITEPDVDEFSSRLRSFTPSIARKIIAKIPDPWLARELRGDLATFLMDRAMFVAAHVKTWMEPSCAWHPRLPMESLS
jgi:hypothetical protein